MRAMVRGLLAVMMLAPVPAAAQELITSYTAHLSQRDHFNSRGQRLTTAAAIIRQDRANFHRFQAGDPGDEWDSVFASMEARARMETLLNRGNATPGAIQAIVNGTPWVTVEVWGWAGTIDHITVTVN